MKRPLHLEEQYIHGIRPKAPFNFDATMHKPDHFPSPDNEWEPGVRWQTMLWKDRLLGLKFMNVGSVDDPSVRLSVWAQDELDKQYSTSVIDEIVYRYNFNLDLASFTASFQDDPELQAVIAKWRGMRPVNYSSLYEYLMIAIVLQNATARRSVSMMMSLLGTYGTSLSFDGKSLLAFWKPRRMNRANEEELRALRIGYRAKSVKRVTEAFVEGAIDEDSLRTQSKEEQTKTLLNLYGIGPASVWYVLFDVFHHWDALDYISPWEQKIYSKLFFGTEPGNPLPVEKLVEFFDARFGKYKMLAVHYVWEDVFWRRATGDVPWLDDLIRL